MMDIAELAPPSPRANAARVEHTRELRGLELTMAQLGVVDLIIGKVRGALTMSALQQSAFRLQRRHPALRARFVLPRGGKVRPSVEFLEPNLERVYVKQVKSGDGLPNAGAPLWARVAEREVNHPFDATAGYMCRVHWIPGADDDEGYVILAAQHALVDGISLMRLLNDLISECGKLLTGPAPHHNDGSALEPLSPTPPLLEQLPPRLYERLATRLAFGALVRSQRDYEGPFPIENTLRAGQAIETQCRFVAGDQANYEPIVAACKAHGTTVGAAFSAATQFASLRLIHAATGERQPRRVKFPMTMDFSMRRLVGASNTQAEVGLLMGACGIGVSVPESIDFWSLARELKKSADTQLKYRQPLLFHQALDRLWDLEQALEAYGVDYAGSGGIAESVNISNVGVYPYPSRAGALSLEAVFGVSSSMKGGPMFIVWLRSFGGRFHYNATSAYPAASRSTGDRLLALLVQLMEGCHSPSYDALTLRDYVNGARSPVLEEN